jgi:hypothetical protein
MRGRPTAHVAFFIDDECDMRHASQERLTGVGTNIVSR